MRHGKVERWEARLRQVFARIDADLEARYGDLWPRHPARPAHGTTANHEADGLFDLGAAFALAPGSAHGPGYVVEVRIATLAQVPETLRRQIETEVADRLRAGLREAFPGKALSVVRDGPVYRITGDLSLD